MTNQTLSMTPALYDYILDVSLREHPVLSACRERTAELTNVAKMQIAPEQGQFMQLLVQLLNAKKTLEVGTFTGYSSLAVALALPEDGRVTALDTSEEWTNIAKTFWQLANVEHKIDLHLNPATDSLQALIDAGESESFDFAFIDADKRSYPTYYEACLQLLRRGGLIAIDNVLQNGRVADKDANDNTTEAIRAFNQTLKNDERVFISMVPIADGLTLARKL